MTAVTAAADRPRLDMGRVVKTTFGAVGGNIVVLGLMSVVLIGVPTGVVEWLGNAAKASGASADTTGGIALLGRLVETITNAVLSGAIIYGTTEHLAGRHAGMGRCWSAGLRNSAKVFGINFISGLGMVLGLILLIVPGVILALRWSVSAPAGVVERLKVGEAMSRSAALTQGNRLRILGLAVCLVVGFLVMALLYGVVVGIVGAIDAGAGAMTEAVGIGFCAAVLTLFIGVGLTVTYAELRSMREGVLPDQLASVFD